MIRAVVAMAAVVFLQAKMQAQDSGAQQPAPVAGRAAEAPINGLVRKDLYTVALTLPAKEATDAAGQPDHQTDHGTELLVQDFEFEGEAVPVSKLHLKQLSPGVVEITSVAYSVGQWRFRVRDAANYYGLGARFDTLNHAHTVVKNLSQDIRDAKGSSTSKPMPFYMSTTGYGLWADTTAEATFDMNASSSTDVIVDVATEKLRIVLFTGPEFPVILDRFTALAGRAVLPPLWAFAPWKSDSYQNQAQVREDIDRDRQLGLPASVILIDSPWETYSGSYKFNPKQFDDAAGMIKYMHQHGYKLVLRHTPWIDSHSGLQPSAGGYDEAAGDGFFVKTQNGTPYVRSWQRGTESPIDFTNPLAKRWWQDQVRQALRVGADGFLDDDAEGSFVGTVKFADGTDPRVMRNRYAVLYHNAVEDLIQKDLKGNGVLLAQNVTQGANGLGMLRGGESEASFSTENGLPAAVTAGLGAGLSGMPLWTTDLNGHTAAAVTDSALFQRWTEYAALSPAMLFSGAGLASWKDGDAALTTYRKFAVLHMSLLPYRYRAAQEAAKDGMPIMRALLLTDQNDSHARSTTDEYMLGPDLLVAPVLNAGTQRTVYLTQGEWIDYWTGTGISGGRTLVVDAAMDSIPLYVRAGAVIPKLPEDVMTLVPDGESGNSKVKAMDDRRVYEIFGSSGTERITDFEGRIIEREAHSLKITGDSAAHIIVRWRFATVATATVNGAAVKLQAGKEGPYVEFNHRKESVVSWQ